VQENQEREKKKMEFKKMVIMTKQHKLQDNLESKKHEANLVWLTKVHAKN